MSPPNFGAWLNCGTDGKPGFGTTVANGPRASRGPGATACGWRLAIFIWATAGAYPGRGCGDCLQASGGGSFCATAVDIGGGVCTPPPATIDTVVAIGAFGICPSGVPFNATDSAAVPTADTNGAWVQFYEGPVPSVGGLGTVTAYCCVRLCYSGSITPPISSECNFFPPGLDYDEIDGCHQDFPDKACTE